jgi:hypothetical protein
MKMLEWVNVLMIDALTWEIAWSQSKLYLRCCNRHMPIKELLPKSLNYVGRRIGQEQQSNTSSKLDMRAL